MYPEAVHRLPNASIHRHDERPPKNQIPRVLSGREFSNSCGYEGSSIYEALSPKREVPNLAQLAFGTIRSRAQGGPLPGPVRGAGARLQGSHSYGEGGASLRGARVFGHWLSSW